MKKLFIPAVFFTCFHMQNSVAQSRAQENIVIQDSDGSNTKKVVIEIKDGSVFIDGKKVSSNINGKNLKIIKEFKKGLTDPGTDVEINIPNVDGLQGFRMQSPDQGGTANRAMLGVVTAPSDAATGALIKEVTPQSAAENAGLKPGDIITKVGQEIITGPEQLVDAISLYSGGERVAIQYTRDGQPKEEVVTLTAKEDQGLGLGLGNGNDFMQGIEEMMKSFKGFDADNGFMKSFGMGAPIAEDAPKMGIQVEDRADGDGVRVTKVTAGSNAEKSGIILDDVLIAFNETTIGSVEDLTRAINGARSDKEVNIKIKRNGKQQTLKMKMPQLLRKKEF